MTSSGRDLIDLSDWAYRRLRRRLKGLTDEEYHWEPVPGCWTVRRDADGTWRADEPGDGDDPTLSTLGWRLSHIVAMLREERNWTWLGYEAPPSVPEGTPGTAADAVDALGRAFKAWRAVLAGTDEESLAQPMGDVAPPGLAEASRRAFALHVLDEFIHHGAEVALMRDLYAAYHAPAGVRSP